MQEAHRDNKGKQENRKKNNIKSVGYIHHLSWGGGGVYQFQDW